MKVNLVIRSIFLGLTCLFASGSSLSSNMEHLGCYNDGPNRDLKHKANVSPLTPLKCLEQCKAKGFSYFGVQAGHQCFCGNSYGNNGKASDNLCSYPCNGDRRVMCGGHWKSNVYKILSAKQDSVSQPQYLGCYSDKEEDRDLKDRPYAKDESMTVTKCHKKCFAASYAFFGVQNGGDCFCGNSYGKHSLVTARQCNIPCTGNSNEMCGGKMRNSVYGILTALPSEVTALGCYKDKQLRRDLIVWDGKKHTDMTPLKCYNMCLTYEYFGLQAGAYCFCGHDYGIYGKASDAECNVPCTGDKRAMCGGSLRNNVYQTNSPARAVTTFNDALGGLFRSSYG